MLNYQDIVCSDLWDIDSFAIKLWIKINAIKGCTNYFASYAVDVGRSSWLKSCKRDGCDNTEILSTCSQIKIDSV